MGKDGWAPLPTLDHFRPLVVHLKSFYEEFTAKRGTSEDERILVGGYGAEWRFYSEESFFTESVLGLAEK